MQHTLIRVSLACQSSTTGMRPSSHSTGLSSLQRVACAALLRHTVNWSPPNKTPWKNSSLIGVFSPWYVTSWVAVGTYLCRFFIIEHILSTLFLLSSHTPRGTYVETMCTYSNAQWEILTTSDFCDISWEYWPGMWFWTDLQFEEYSSICCAKTL